MSAFSDFWLRLLAELKDNGKSLVAWVLNESALTAYPGIVQALQAYVADHSKQNLYNLFFQLLWAVASGHRLLKILNKVLLHSR
jgi:hypothetical protein